MPGDSEPNADGLPGRAVENLLFFSEKFFPPQYAATETATSERYKPVKLITGFRTVEYASVNKVLLFVVDTCMDEEHTNIKFGIPLVQFRRSIALPTSEIWP